MQKSVYIRSLFFIASIAISCNKWTTSVIYTSSCSLSNATIGDYEYIAAQGALDTFRCRNHIPGVLLLVHKNGQKVIACASGYSNLELHQKVNVCDQFRTASITKTFVATVIMELVQRGKLKLEFSLLMVLPELKHKIPNADCITIKELLNHTSGTHDFQEDFNYRLDMFNDPEKTCAKTTEELLESYVYGKKAQFKPGLGWNYSNTDYLFLEMIARRICALSMQKILENEIFNPLGMSQTYYEPRNDGNLIRGYRNLYQNGYLTDTKQWDRTDDGHGDGGIVSTLNDLQVFIQALFKGKLVSNSILSEMVTNLVNASNCPDYCNYGLGFQKWTIGQNKIGLGHAGTSYGSRAYMFYFPVQKSDFVLFMNLGDAPTRKSMAELIDFVIN